jgi:hypothetical protein
MATEQDRRSVIPTPEVAGDRDVDTAPYVELYHGRLQGVVSAGSDPNRVYCAFVEANTGNYYSSTNNNRPDNGMDKRMRWLIGEAVAQYGAGRVARFLGIPEGKGGDEAAIASWVFRNGRVTRGEAGDVFSRFLVYLRFVELQAAQEPIPEMAWFVGQ